MKVKVAQSSIGQAGAQKVQIGEIKLGPVQVGQLSLNKVQVGLSSGVAELRGVSISLGLAFSLDWTFSLKIEGLELLPSFLVRQGSIDFGAMAVDIPFGDIPLAGLELLKFDIPNLQATDLKLVIGAIKNLKLGALLAERIQAQNLAAPGTGFRLDGLGLGSVQAQGVDLPDATLARATVGRVCGGSVPLDKLSIPGLALPQAPVKQLRVTGIQLQPKSTTEALGPAGGGLLTTTLTVTVSAGMKIDELILDDIMATATVGDITLKNLSLPCEVLDLSLSQIGIADLQIPRFEVS